VGELGGAAVAYMATGSLAAAAVTATVGASVGYYATAYISALRPALSTALMSEPSSRHFVSRSSVPCRAASISSVQPSASRLSVTHTRQS